MAEYYAVVLMGFKLITVLLMLMLAASPFLAFAWGRPVSGKFAVVVGVGKAPWSGGENLHSDSDASLMTSVLKNKYGFYASHIKTLINADATRESVLSALQWLVDSEGAGSTVVVFFSGHGGTMLYSGSISDSEIAAYVQQLESQKSLVMVQGCYSGRFIPLLSGANRIVATSTTADGVSADGSRYSVYCTMVVYYGIKRGSADFNGDGVVAVEEALLKMPYSPVSDMYTGDMLL